MKAQVLFLGLQPVHFADLFLSAMPLTVAKYLMQTPQLMPQGANKSGRIISNPTQQIGPACFSVFQEIPFHSRCLSLQHLSVSRKLRGSQNFDRNLYISQ
jgi:hypothetical protein